MAAGDGGLLTVRIGAMLGCVGLSLCYDMDANVPGWLAGYHSAFAGMDGGVAQKRKLLFMDENGVCYAWGLDEMWFTFLSTGSYMDAILCVRSANTFRQDDDGYGFVTFSWS